MSEDELSKFKDYIVLTQKSLGIGKSKALAAAAGFFRLLTVEAGVTLAILFPNPITIAVLGGLAVLSNWRNPKKMLKKIREKTKRNDVLKADLAAIESRLKDLETEKAIQRTLYPSVNPFS